MTEDLIPQMFINHAADVIADTQKGLTGSEIVKACVARAIEVGVDIPHQLYPFEAGSKRAALRENLAAFDPAGQFELINELCDHEHLQRSNPDEARKLKLALVSRFGHLARNPLVTDVSEEVIEGTKHWLETFPQVLDMYNQSLGKYRQGNHERNVLDDLRLALEMLLREVLGNAKSLENQMAPLGAYLKSLGGSKEFRDMFVALLKYYTNYQNEHVKHNDAVNEDEIEFIIELTSSFMRHFVRMAGRGAPS